MDSNAASNDLKNQIQEIFIPETPKRDSKVNIFSNTLDISPNRQQSNNWPNSIPGDIIDVKSDTTSQNPISEDDQKEVFNTNTSPNRLKGDKNSLGLSVPQSSSHFENDKKSNRSSKAKNGVTKLTDVSKINQSRVSLSTRKFSAPKICRWAKSIIAGTNKNPSTLPEMQHGVRNLQNMMGLAGINGISDVDLSTLSQLQEVNLPENLKNMNRSNFDMGLAVDRKLDALFGGARGPKFEASLASTMISSSSPSPPTPFAPPEFAFPQNPSFHPQNLNNFNFNSIDSLSDIRLRNHSLHLPSQPKSVPISHSPSFPLPHSPRPPPLHPSLPSKRPRLSNFPEISSLDDKSNIRFSPSDIAKLLLKQDTFALPPSCPSLSPPSISPSPLSSPSPSSQSISQAAFTALSTFPPSTSSLSLSSLSRTRSSPVTASPSPSKRQRLRRFPSAPSPFSMMDLNGFSLSPLLPSPSDGYTTPFSSDLKMLKFDPERFILGKGPFEVKEVDKNEYNLGENGQKRNFEEISPTVEETDMSDSVFTAPFIFDSDEGNNQNRRIGEIQEELKAVTEIDIRTENGTPNRIDMAREIRTVIKTERGTTDNGMETIIEPDLSEGLMSMGQLSHLDLSNRRDLDSDLANLHGFSSIGCSSSSPNSFSCLSSTQSLNSNSTSSMISNSNLNSNCSLIPNSSLNLVWKREMESAQKDSQFQYPDSSGSTQFPCQKTSENRKASIFSDFDIIQQQQQDVQKHDNFRQKEEMILGDKIPQKDKCAQNNEIEVDLESNSLLDYLGFKWPNIGKIPDSTTGTNSSFENEQQVFEGTEEFLKPEHKVERRGVGVHEDSKLGDFYLRAWNAVYNK